MGSSNYDPEDSFISDEEEETCPLCVEEMDISDKNFKPCPCGYQVCQFCYNNIRQNPQLNGKCPACRRPYDDESVEYRVISPEEWKHEQAKQTRRDRERKQREREKKETEQTSKKHLSGMRVIQKNLVYVIGLNPSIPTEELHHTLRTEQFFGQYGKIQKIVINRRNNSNGHPGLGVYVTFARKEDAARCIAAVDGSINDGKYLRAAYGTTKYCSSYLRGQSCPNPNCMFLHEPGEEADSYTRQDLSTIQHVARQGTTPSAAQGSAPQHQAAPPQAPQSQQPKARKPLSSEQDFPPIGHHQEQQNSEHGSALPASVSWANKASPVVSAAKIHQPAYPPLPIAKPTVPAPEPAPTKEDHVVVPRREAPKPNPAMKFMEDSLKALSAPSFDYKFSQEIVSSQHVASSFPLFSFTKACSNDEPAVADRELPPYIFTSISLTSSHPRFNALLPLKEPELIHTTPLMHTPVISNAQNLARYDNLKTSTPPPPGLAGNNSNNATPSQNSQELLARLMKRDTGLEA